MRIGILGAGALGRAYAAVLAHAGSEITFVVRRLERDCPQLSYRAEQFGLFNRVRHVRADLALELPDCDALLVTLRGDQLSEPVIDAVAKTTLPTVVLSAVASEQVRHAWLQRPELAIATPSVLSVRDGQDVRYWVPPFGRTRLHLPGAPEIERKVIRALCVGGVPARRDPNAARIAHANGAALLPLQQLAVTVPDVARWRHEPALLERVVRGNAALRTLRAELGSPDAMTAQLVWALGAPWRLRCFSRLAPGLLPGAVAFVREHFGLKLTEQTEQLCRDVLWCARTSQPSALSELSLALAELTAPELTAPPA